MNKILSITKDIEKSFKRLSLMTIVAVGGSLIVTMTVALWALNFAEKQRSKIYVLDQGKSLLLALQTDSILSKDVEIRDHVTRFHELMFTLSPQKQTIQENLDRAFNLAEKGYYSRLVSANISQQMIVDSVKFVSTSYPYQVRTYARQYVVRESTVSQYAFVSTCQLINAGRSDVNPHGLIIEKFKVVQNDLVETRKR